MADSKPAGAELPVQPVVSIPAPDAKPEAKPSKPVKPPNPVWKMMGLPNLPKKLPSRNWLIFFSLTGSLMAAVTYDKREKKRAQAKWCKLVEHLRDEPLEPGTMPRRLTVFLEAPPADGLRYSQDHFKDYVKPILVASGLDWDFIQGRKEGDVRAELAERIRKLRNGIDPNDEEEDPTLRIRASNGIREYDGPQGDIVIGRNTWKEYVRGLHEGWLGPLTPPAEAREPEEKKSEVKTDAGITLLSEPRDATPEELAGSAEKTGSAEADEKKKKPKQPKPFIKPDEYSSALLPTQLPNEFSPSNTIPLPHILGFLKTPQRFWRFLHRRELADNIGRDVAAVILNTHSRPFQLDTGMTLEAPLSFISDSPTSDPGSTPATPAQNSEQAQALVFEEKEWHKSVREPIKDVTVQPERPWLEPVILDARIGSRMRKSELTPEDEARANSFKISEEEIEGWIKGTFRTIFRDTAAWAKGNGKHKGPELGDLDVDSVTGEGPVSENKGFMPGTVGGMRMPNPGTAGKRGLSRFQ